MLPHFPFEPRIDAHGTTFLNSAARVTRIREELDHVVQVVEEQLDRERRHGQRVSAFNAGRLCQGSTQLRTVYVFRGAVKGFSLPCCGVGEHDAASFTNVSSRYAQHAEGSRPEALDRSWRQRIEVDRIVEVLKESYWPQDRVIQSRCLEVVFNVELALKVRHSFWGFVCVTYRRKHYMFESLAVT